MPQYFSVKNFDELQHYKDRNPPWIKFYNTTLEDYEVARLPDASKAHLFAIWLLASRSKNKLPYDANWIATKINATAPVDLDLLQNAGFIITNQQDADLLADCKHNARTEQSRADQSREREYYAKNFAIWWKQYLNKKSIDYLNNKKPCN